jgi:hypothetical protein
MELKLFTEGGDIGEVAGGVEAIVNLPKAESEATQQTLDEI